MNRRQLFAAVAAAALAPGELWTPKRTIFLPPRGGWPGPHWPLAHNGLLIRKEGEMDAELLERVVERVNTRRRLVDMPAMTFSALAEEEELRWL